MNFKPSAKNDWGAKRVGAKLMAENPVHFLAYDLLEYQGEGHS